MQFTTRLSGLEGQLAELQAEIISRPSATVPDHTAVDSATPPAPHLEMATPVASLQSALVGRLHAASVPISRQ